MLRDAETDALPDRRRHRLAGPASSPTSRPSARRRPLQRRRRTTGPASSASKASVYDAGWPASTPAAMDAAERAAFARLRPAWDSYYAWDDQVVELDAGRARRPASPTALDLDQRRRGAARATAIVLGIADDDRDVGAGPAGRRWPPSRPAAQTRATWLRGRAGRAGRAAGRAAGLARSPGSLARPLDRIRAVAEGDRRRRPDPARPGCAGATRSAGLARALDQPPRSLRARADRRRWPARPTRSRRVGRSCRRRRRRSRPRRRRPRRAVGRGVRGRGGGVAQRGDGGRGCRADERLDPGDRAERRRGGAGRRRGGDRGARPPTRRSPKLGASSTEIGDVVKVITVRSRSRRTCWR